MMTHWRLLVILIPIFLGSLSPMYANATTLDVPRCRELEEGVYACLTGYAIVDDYEASVFGTLEQTRYRGIARVTSATVWLYAQDGTVLAVGSLNVPADLPYGEAVKVEGLVQSSFSPGEVVLVDSGTVRVRHVTVTSVRLFLVADVCLLLWQSWAWPYSLCLPMPQIRRELSATIPEVMALLLRG